jgi:hypothetical protein
VRYCERETILKTITANHPFPQNGRSQHQSQTTFHMDENEDRLLTMMNNKRHVKLKFFTSHFLFSLQIGLFGQKKKVPNKK